MNSEINRIIIETLLPFKPKQICVFGSYARGEMTEESDIDILIDVPYNISYLDVGTAYNVLEDKLKRRIDLLFKDSLSSIFKPYILKDSIEIYHD